MTDRRKILVTMAAMACATAWAIAIGAGYDRAEAASVAPTRILAGVSPYLADPTATPARVRVALTTTAACSAPSACVWGRNALGQLGDGTITDRTVPVRLSSLTNLMAVASGQSHSVALRVDGTIWTWGSNN